MMGVVISRIANILGVYQVSVCIPDPARTSLARKGKENVRNIKLVDLENLAPSPESLT